ncbi:MAG TPA: hypothetical protein VHU91_07270, partial [Mycobacteriales bacterium]|nr:hypothetical protein [Mycobacteriales bacterium]
MARIGFRSALVFLVTSTLFCLFLYTPKDFALADDCDGSGSISQGKVQVGAKCEQPGRSGSRSGGPVKDVADYFNLCAIGPTGCGMMDCPAGQVPYARLDKPDGTNYTKGHLYCAAPSRGDVAGRALVEFRQYRPVVPAATVEPGGWALTNYPSVFSST